MNDYGEGAYFASTIERTRKEVIPSYRDLAFRWLDMSHSERIASQLPTLQRDFAKSIGIGTTKMSLFKREFYALNMKGKIDKALSQAKVEEGEIDAVEWSRSKMREWLEGTLKSAKAGNAQSQRLLAQMGNVLIEKSEVIHKIDGSILAREILEARRELEKAGMDTTIY